MDEKPATEKLERLKALILKTCALNDAAYKAVANQMDQQPAALVLIGQDEILVAVREFLDGDETALRILADEDEKRKECACGGPVWP